MQFSTFITEGTKDTTGMKPVVIAPGRFNPPHLGHRLVIDKLVKLSEELDAQPVVLIIDSGKYGPRNPLVGEVRKVYLEHMFSGVRFDVYQNAFEAIVQLAEHKEFPVGGVSGADRGHAYKGMVSKIYGEEVGESYLSEVLHRDPDSNEDIIGISGTKAREAAMEGNTVAFRAMTGLDNMQARTLMKMLVDGMEADGV